MKYSIFIFFFSVLLLFIISSWRKDNLAYEIPIEFTKLENDLRVFLSLDHTTPLVMVTVYYNIGYWTEAKDCANFASVVY